MHRVPESDYSVTVGGLPCTGLDVNEAGTAITCLPPQSGLIFGTANLVVTVSLIVCSMHCFGRLGWWLAPNISVVEKASTDSTYRLTDPPVNILRLCFCNHLISAIVNLQGLFCYTVVVACLKIPVIRTSKAKPSIMSGAKSEVFGMYVASIPYMVLMYFHIGKL